MNNTLSLKDYLENTVFEIYTGDNGEKYVHFFGYGYLADEIEDGKPYRFVQFTFFEAPLKEVLSVGFYAFENKYSEECKQYIQDCDEQTCLDTYLHYDNGNTPVAINSVDENTPNGCYVLIQY